MGNGIIAMHPASDNWQRLTGNSMFQRAIVTVLVCLNAFAAQAADEAAWLQEARAREGKVIRARKLESKDKWLKARVPAKTVGAIEKVEGSYSIELDIGGESSIHCEIVPDGIDIAETIHRTLELTLQGVEKSLGTIESHAIERIDAGAFGNVPYLQTEWLYRVNQRDEARLGAVKQIAMQKAGQGIYCALVELGYTKTFEAVTRALAETLETETTDPAPYYLEIATLSFGNREVGVSMTTFGRDEVGDTFTEVSSALLVPAPDGSVHSQDSMHTEWVRPDGAMINAVDFVAADGEVTTNVALRQTDGTWFINGEIQGKKVNQPVAPEAEPGSSLALALGLRRILAAPEPVGIEYAMPQWVAIDPSRVMDMKITVVSKRSDDHFYAIASLEDLRMNLTLDRNGMAAAAEFPLGPQIARIERIAVSGSF